MSEDVAITYELWDAESNNLWGAYDSEAAALTAVRKAALAYGRASAEALTLGYQNPPGRFHPIAEGTGLVSRANAQVRVARR